MYCVHAKSKTLSNRKNSEDTGEKQWTDDRGEAGQRARGVEQRREGARFCAYLT